MIKRVCTIALTALAIAFTSFAGAEDRHIAAVNKEAVSNAAQQRVVARELYEKVVLGGFDMSLLKQLCTDSFVDRLRKANTIYESGYAVWLLRTGVQDGPGSSEVLDVKNEGPYTVLVTYSDMGYRGSTRLIMVRENGVWKVDNALKADGSSVLE